MNKDILDLQFEEESKTTFNINEIYGAKYGIKSFQEFNRRYKNSISHTKTAYDNLYMFLSSIELYLTRKKTTGITDPLVYLAYLHYDKKLTSVGIHKIIGDLSPYKSDSSLLDSFRKMFEWETLGKDEMITYKKETVTKNKKVEIKDESIIESEREQIKIIIHNLISYRKKSYNHPTVEIDENHLSNILGINKKEIEEKKLIYSLSCLLHIGEELVPEFLNKLRNEDNTKYISISKEIYAFICEKGYGDKVKVNQQIISRIAKSFGNKKETVEESNSNNKQVVLSEKEKIKLNELIEKVETKRKNKVVDVICTFSTNKIDKLIYILECYGLIEVGIEKRFKIFLENLKEQGYKNSEIGKIINGLLKHFKNNRLLEKPINTDNVRTRISKK